MQVLGSLAREYGFDLNTPWKDLPEQAHRVILYGTDGRPVTLRFMGFSDGATYALSVGTANPELFKRVIVFSPGPAYLGKSATDQYVFISHGEEDKVLSFANARGFASKLRVRHVPVDFEKFTGGHEVPKAIKEKAFAFFRDPAAAVASAGPEGAGRN